MFILIVMVSLPSMLMGQVVMSDMGIGIQGILRKADNVALVNRDVNIDVIVALETGDELFKRENVPVSTNVNGVFTYTLALDDSFFAALATSMGQDVRLKVFYADDEVINSRLNPVPYAVSSGNGIPVGAIVPYAGNVLPPGFLPCNGFAITGDVKYAKLRSLVGDKTPDLRGMFLRGARTPQNSDTAWPLLKSFQTPGIPAHKHNIDLNTTTNEQNLSTGEGASDDYFPAALVRGSGKAHKIEWSGTIGAEGLYNFEPEYVSIDPHVHGFKGSTVADEVQKVETRPYNYGVDYIIKY